MRPLTVSIFNSDNMKYVKNKLFALSLLCLSVDVYSANLVVGTYNIDAKVMGDHLAQKKLMLNSNVDIFGLQEVNYNNERFADKNVHKYNSLSKFTDDFYKYSYYGNALKFASGGYGIATVSSMPFKSEKSVHLVLNEISQKYISEFEKAHSEYDPTKPETMSALDAMWKARKGIMEPRIYTRVVIEKDGEEIAFYNTHLSVNPEDIKKKQIKQLINVMLSDPVKYKILVGDFNANQSTVEWDVWRENFNIANGADHIFYDTYIQESPDMKVKSVDNIIVSKNIVIKSVHKIPSSLSDHVPLIAELEFH
ncbi:endonuclease/exonuclease/phosphatase family protein [Hafnia alvei]|uniref:endonuclease/exonuclease/phosphatase family protein n=1 Tax=Hafnia alvei TaxID=569 RepID=UPI002DBFBBFA|nr:endonuclease/exonuclease/phosphatase family protein [Hafnia alvei]MEB7889828.1 endonuclease/exonuclease/phosphatase family protein [Hafnia alvei]